MDSGQVVNHISTDAQNISMSMMFLHNGWAALLKIFLALMLTINELGVAALLGFLVLLVLIPVNYILAAKMGQFQKKGLGISFYNIMVRQGSTCTMVFFSNFANLPRKIIAKFFLLPKCVIMDS